MRELLSSIENEYRRYKALAESAIAQLHDDELRVVDADGSNSVVQIVRHMSGNLRSRFTDFIASDGEKPWRDRDDEFVLHSVARAELMEQWEQGWRALFDAIAPLGDADLSRTVTIRGHGMKVHEALHRSLAHASYHVGQIVFIAKLRRGSEWRSLSIPLGQSAAYNQAPAHESASAHAETLNRRERS